MTNVSVLKNADKIVHSQQLGDALYEDMEEHIVPSE